MLLRSLRLRNIRSYTDETVEFPDGVSVFTGDIGSGKSTLLYAIEFALFGSTSDMPMQYLLRHGERNGMVELGFEVEGREYTVHREIERKKDDKYSSKKKGNWVKYKGAKVNYSPAEMKEQVLKTILQFNESLAPRASSVIYRFAVFTPQEEMKRILEQRDEDRLKTLRRAFRVEDYKVAQENVKVIHDKIRSDRKKLEGKADDLKEKQETLEEKRGERKEQMEELEGLADRYKGLKEDLAGRRGEKERLEKLEREKMNLERYHESTLKDVEHHRTTLKRAREELKEADEAREQMEELEPKIEDLDRVKREIGEMEARREEYQEKARDVVGLEKDRDNLVSRIEELEGIMEAEPDLRARAKELERSIGKAETDRKRMEENREKVARTETRLEALKKEWGERYNEKEGFKELEGKARCPKCGQELTPEHLETVLSGLEEELGELDKTETKLKRDLGNYKERVKKYSARSENLETLREEFHRVQGELDRLEREGDKLEDLRKQATRQEVDLKAARGSLKKSKVDEDRYRKLKERQEELEQLAKRFVLARAKVEGASKWRDMAVKAEAELDKKQDKLGDIADELEGLFEVYDDDTLKKARTGFEEAREALAQCEKEIESKKVLLERMDKELEQIGREIERKEEFRERAEEHGRAERFINECFNGALDVIEKHVLASINEEFETLFQKWFNMLIESPEIQVRIDENFTPIIEQGGYELDHWALSGGERTSVALAYRLALNAMVKRTSTTMKENLMILDEPTDGFSMEQLSRVRDVLDQLDSDQCIIVSHEREIEGFADRVYRVVKDGGASRIIQ